MITREWDKSNALSKISQLAAVMAKFDQAVKIANSITDEYSKSKGYIQN